MLQISGHDKKKLLKNILEDVVETPVLCTLRILILGSATYSNISQDISQDYQAGVSSLNLKR